MRSRPAGTKELTEAANSIADIMEHHESSKVSNWSEVNNADRSCK